MFFIWLCHQTITTKGIDKHTYGVILNYNTIDIYDLILSLMETTQKKFIHSKLFKLAVLVVYVYSFVQMGADESPIKIDLIQLDDPFMMKKIQLEVSAPMTIMVKIFGKDDAEPAENVDSDQSSSD